MRAVFDTNIVVSALLWAGAPFRALDAAIEGKIDLIASETLLTELRSVLARPKFSPRMAAINQTVDELLGDYRALVEVVEPARTEPVVLDDPTDDAVLACAVGGEADCIVSGDDHLIALGAYAGIPIWDVHRFLEEVLSSTGS
ncbi:MAG: putative toxin-antitoxin system toxin component, PIN family [Anaerolineae bacterium]